MDEKLIWKPDQGIMYIMECVDDPGFFLHNAALVWPKLSERKLGIWFSYMLNREHGFFGMAEEQTEDTLRIRCLDESCHEGHVFLIRPMTEEDLVVVKRKYGRGETDHPLTLEECFRDYARGVE